MSQEAADKIAWEHLIRELMKEIPLVGKMLEAMSYGVRDDVHKAEDKEKLYGMLTAASADLGDILTQLQQQRDFSEQMQQSILMLAHYVEGKADAKEIVRVEESAVAVDANLLPASVDSVAHYLSAAPADRFTLNKTLLGMVPIRVDEIIGDIPGAK